jgi:hypothetical protein
VIRSATRTDALPTRFSRSTPDGRLIWRSMFFGPAPSPASSSTLAAMASDLTYVDPMPGEQREPQAFLIEQEAGAVVHPHFHYVDQFQVVVAGGGSLGRHAVSPVSVHFAAACTGYGPIQPGDQGLSYFTFRASADHTGAQYLPAARERMRPLPRRNVVVDALRISDAQGLAARTDSIAEPALDNEDGLAVFLLRLAPGDTIAAPDAALGGGASMLVVAGALVRDAVRLTAWSCLYAAPEDGAIPLQADAGGAEVLVMRYPRKNLAAS